MTAAEVQALVTTYKAAHPGNGGKDWDVIGCCGGASAPALQLIATDPTAQKLRSLCGPGKLAVIPQIAWEYGGSDHSWINPSASPLVICVYMPVKPYNANWTYDPVADKVTASVYVLFPDQNPCKSQTGANQVLACLGDSTNIDILVDTASYHDGADIGVDVSNAGTQLNLIQPNGTSVSLSYTP
jgi:hypothetical protein